MYHDMSENLLPLGKGSTGAVAVLPMTGILPLPGANVILRDVLREILDRAHAQVAGCDVAFLIGHQPLATMVFFHLDMLVLDVI